MTDPDARIDVGEALERSSTKTTVRHLAQQGYRNVKVLDHRRIQELMDESLRAALAAFYERMPEADRAQLGQDAREAFSRALARSQGGQEGGAEPGALADALGRAQRAEDEVRLLVPRLDAQDAELARLRAAPPAPPAAPTELEEVPRETLQLLEDNLKEVLSFFADLTHRKEIALKDPAALDLVKDFRVRQAVLIARFLDAQVKDAAIQAKAEYIQQVEELRGRLGALARELERSRDEVRRLEGEAERSRAEAARAMAVRAEAGPPGEAEKGQTREDLDLRKVNFYRRGNYLTRSKRRR